MPPALVPAPVKSSPARARWSAALAALLLVAMAFTTPADAQSPPPTTQQGQVLHEFVPPDPGEDVSFAATTLEGDLPAAVSWRATSDQVRQDLGATTNPR